MASRSAGLGNPVSKALTMSWARSRSSIVITWVPAGSCPAVAAASLSASSRVDEGWLSPAETTAMVRGVIGGSPVRCCPQSLGAASATDAATRASWVGPSGTLAGRFASSSRRSTGTTSPSRSSCSSTVFSGRPAWSIRNSCRW